MTPEERIEWILADFAYRAPELQVEALRGGMRKLVEEVREEARQPANDESEAFPAPFAATTPAPAEGEPRWTGSLCPVCGVNVAVDEDGCCSTCGCTAVGEAAERVLKILQLAADADDALRDEVAMRLYTIHVQLGAKHCFDAADAFMAERGAYRTSLGQAVERLLRGNGS